jgi:segregation and condensation protein B|tara:strand:- start:572 stop:1216 length:645 start_codon:yes stop_codon:yes gene_type:complete
METLAVVAYRQPVMRAEIEKIRGVQCGEILRQLMERAMVRIAGRADELGRPFLYGTTRNFLEVFGLRSLDELPRASMLRAGGVHGDNSANGAEKDRCEEEEIEEPNVIIKDSTEEVQDTDNLKPSREMLVDEHPDQDDDIDDLDDDDVADEDEEDDGFSDEEWEEVEDEPTDGDEEDEQWEDEDEDEEWDDTLDEDDDPDEDEDKDEQENTADD